MAAVVNAETCVGCGACEGACPVAAITLQDGKSVVNAEACVECGSCVSACPVEAITL